jgi:hypothetical protein
MKSLLFLLTLALTLPAHALTPIGAFALPRVVAGHSTAYSAGTLSLRTVNGQQRLFSDAGGLIYEATVPALRSKPPYLTARFYGPGARPTLAAPARTCDMTQAHSGPLAGRCTTRTEFTDRCSASMDLTTGRVTDHTLAIPQLWQRGGTLVCPPWFVRLTGEARRMDSGAITRFSKGEAMDQLLRFPGISSWSLEATHRCPRPANCWSYDTDWYFSDSRHWTAADEIGGESCAAAAIFTPDALMFFVSLGTGRIWYGDDGFMSGVHCEARENWIAEFDPADIVKVWRGTLAPWEPKPTWSYLWASGGRGGPGRAAESRALGRGAAVGRASWRWADAGIRATALRGDLIKR